MMSITSRKRVGSEPKTKGSWSLTSWHNELQRAERSAPESSRWKKVRPTEAADKPSWSGWKGAGGGSMPVLDAPPEFRGPTVQVAGLFPFSAGGSLPLVGAVLGHHLAERGVVCGDPVSWFVNGLINNPSCFVLGRPGVGKSSLMVRLLIQLYLRGIIPLVLGDVKGEYADTIRRLNGQVLTPGKQYVNPLDKGPLASRLHKLPEEDRGRAEADLEARRTNVLTGLCELAIREELQAHERNVLAAAPSLWERMNPGRTPVIPDLLALVKQRPKELRQIVNDRGNDDRYDDRCERVIDALIALSGAGEFGDLFARQTSEPIDMYRPVCFDMTAVFEREVRLQGALQLVCWSYGSSQVAAAKYLADVEDAGRRTYFMVMDELWRPLQSAPFMVDRVDELTRLNRTLNLGQALATHTMDDLKLGSEEATAKAWGFVSRSEMVFLGGLAPSEMGNLRTVFALSRREESMLTDWSVKGEVNPENGQHDPPPGRGKFLLKVGKSVGTPFRVNLTDLEANVHDTNEAWGDTKTSMAGSNRMSGRALPEEVVRPVDEARTRAERDVVRDEQEVA